MKHILIAGALILGLTACNRDDTTTPTPVVEGAYNPDASATEDADKTRVPYVGDWVWAAKLPDNSYKLGTLSITTRGDETDEAKNGGLGTNALCADDTCATPSGSDFGLLLSAVSNGEAQLVAILGESTGNGNRLVITDSDDRVTLNAQGRPTVSGSGTWQNAQVARAAFVQVDATPDGTVLPEAFVQARAAADAVTLQRLSLPTLDLDAILK
ncbi:hypothetical protein V3W47_17780 [Deinococcus sp. YIM 134068]|uniref:hypothetical protein n=1 Tax=Deinococcus lichenicola TaxID=3118910 RepID=UPI002F924E0D